MENNRELNEMIFQNFGELYDAVLNYLRDRKSVGRERV